MCISCQHVLTVDTRLQSGHQTYQKEIDRYRTDQSKAHKGVKSFMSDKKLKAEGTTQEARLNDRQRHCKTGYLVAKHQQLIYAR